MSILECKELTKSFLGRDALRDVSFSVEPGRIVGLLGPNGSGKTTLIKLACGLLTPGAGEILIDGKAPSAETNGIVSYLPDRPVLPGWMTVSQAAAFYEDFYADFRRDMAEELLQKLSLPLDQRVKALSKGMQEKLQLVLVMSRRAKLYLLDEPIGGVDPAARDAILHTIIAGYDEGASVILSTHLIADVETVLDDVIFLREGRVAMQDSVEHIREEKGMSVDALFREVFRYVG